VESWTGFVQRYDFGSVREAENLRFSKHLREFARKRTKIKTIQKKIRIYIQSRTWKAAIVQSEFTEAVDGCSFTCPAFQWLSSLLRLYCLLRFISLTCVHPCAGEITLILSADTK
jgi:hypothetical protein